MATGNKYRARALDLLAQANAAKNAATRIKLESLAAAFLSLAKQAQRNADLVIDFAAASGTTIKAKIGMAPG